MTRDEFIKLLINEEKERTAHVRNHYRKVSTDGFFWNYIEYAVDGFQPGIDLSEDGIVYTTFENKRTGEFTYDDFAELYIKHDMYYGGWMRKKNLD